MRLAFCVNSLGEAEVETLDRLPDAFGCTLCAVFCTAGMVALEFGDGFELAEGLLLDGFGFVFIVQDGFEFLFLAVDDAEGLGVVEGEATFLDAGVAFDSCAFSGFGIGDLREAKVFSAEFRNFCSEVESVDRVLGWVGEEPGNVEDSFFVFQIGVLAIEGELPYAEAFVDRVARGGAGRVN